MDRLLRATQSNRINNDHAPTLGKLPDDAIIAIRKAEYTEAYKIHLTFDDGFQQIVDFEPFLKKSQHPLIRKYLDLELFQDFTVAHGDLFWNDYDLCFPIVDLYENNL